MKLLHTADWQLGMKAQLVGEAGTRVREERLLTASKVVETARSHQVNLIVVAGDVFEDNGVDRILVQKVADILASFEGAVFIIPGNHDPLTPGSVWEHPVWKSSKNVHVLREEKPVELSGGLLYPCPLNEKHANKDPTAWIRATKGEGIRIGVAHGTVEGIHQDEPDYPIPRDAAHRAGLDYLALGHWHSTVTYEAANGVVRMAYSGTHETTRFGERNSGNVLIVEISNAGEPPEVIQVHTGSLMWEVVQAELREPGDLSRIREKIESMENSKSTLVDLRVTGLLNADEQSEIDRICEILSSRFLFARVASSELHPSPEDESWLSGLPPGIVSEAAARLRELANPNFAGLRPEGASPEIATKALMELYAMIAKETP